MPVSPSLSKQASKQGQRRLRVVALSLTFCTAISSAITGNAAQAKPPAFDGCFELHGQAYGVDADLLRALARTESSMKPAAMNLSHEVNTGSVDIGLMQINSRWLPTLARHGIHRTDLADACTNIEVGAWILSKLLRDKGNDWAAVGAWNAACTQLKGDDCRRARAKFAWKVHANWRRANDSAAASAPAPRPMPVARPGLLRTSELRVATPTLTAEADE